MYQQIRVIFNGLNEVWMDMNRVNGYVKIAISLNCNLLRYINKNKKLYMGYQ
jgi:hypothetical protein